MFDPQHVRNWYNHRSFYTRKGQVNQAKAVNTPFTIEANKLQAYKEFLIKNGYAREPLKEYVEKINWVPSKTFSQNLEDANLNYEKIYHVKFYYDKLAENDYCYGYSALYTEAETTQISAVYDTLYPNFFHHFNANSTVRNPIAGSMTFSFQDTDVFFTSSTSENPYDLRGNLVTSPNNAFFSYSVDTPAVQCPRYDTQFPYKERIADNIDDFMNSTYVYLIKTRDRPSIVDGWYVMTSAPTFQILDSFTSVEVFYTK